MGVSIVAAKVTDSILPEHLFPNSYVFIYWNYPNMKNICLMLLLINVIPLTLPQGAGRGNLGIYIKSIVKGGPAEMVRSKTFLMQLNLRFAILGRILME